MDRRLRLALVSAIILHGPLVIAGRYRLSFDVYTHMFFADHYRQSWWTLWEPRWYTGFSVASYPPLVHQLIALLSFFVGIETAWAMVLLGVLVALPTGVYAFARLFVARRAAGYAALVASVLPSVSLTAHAFGQLPTLVSLLATLCGLAMLGKYLKNGGWIRGMLAVTLIAVVAASHHVTLLFLVWGVPLVGAHTALTTRTAIPSVLRRFIAFGSAATIAVLLVIWPFWRWELIQTMQTPIDHLSRHDFLTSSAPSLFFWPMYGPLVLLIPWALWTMFQLKRIALGILFVVMFILGTGGTTSLPLWLYGRFWEWLTYDRFALWASVALLPFVGLAVVVIERKTRRQANRIWPVLASTMLATVGLAALGAALLPSLLPTQPEPIDMKPIVTFLSENNHDQWRYLTFGFGDQMARLSLLTRATTIDGSYHTARELPELRSSGIGQIDAAVWSPQGVGTLDPILDKSSEYGVRWGFVNLAAYKPVLLRHSWVPLTTLANGVEVWENPAARLPVYNDSDVNSDPVAATSWGIFPLTVLVLAITLAKIGGYLSFPQEIA